MEMVFTQWPVAHLATQLAWGAAAVLAADLMSGVVHWAEDAYARKDTPIIGKWIGAANIEHHEKPRAMVARTWWQSSWDLVLLSSIVLAIAAWQDFLSWQLLLFAVVAANANQVHKWTHRTREENGWLISKLQDWKVVQTKRQHARHHTGRKDSYYCAITNWVNPVLERLRVWKRLEWVLLQAFGLQRRADPTVKT